MVGRRGPSTRNAIFHDFTQHFATYPIHKLTIIPPADRPKEDDVPEPQLRGEPGVPQVHRGARRLRLPLLRLRTHPPGVREATRSRKPSSYNFWGQMAVPV